MSGPAVSAVVALGLGDMNEWTRWWRGIAFINSLCSTSLHLVRQSPQNTWMEWFSCCRY